MNIFTCVLVLSVFVLSVFLREIKLSDNSGTALQT